MAQLRGDDFLKKAHDFRDAEAQCAVAKQSRIKLVQVSRALKENIGGALALGGYPVVGHVLQKIGHRDRGDRVLVREELGLCALSATWRLKPDPHSTAHREFVGFSWLHRVPLVLVA